MADFKLGEPFALACTKPENRTQFPGLADYRGRTCRVQNPHVECFARRNRAMTSRERPAKIIEFPRVRLSPVGQKGCP